MRLPLLLAATGILLARYVQLTSWAGDAVLYFFLLPIAVLLLQRKKLSSFGLGIGKWKLGIPVAIAGSAASILAVWAATALSPSLQSFYGAQELTPRLVIETIAYMFAWEFLLRGYLLHSGTPRRANAAQSILFFLAHYGKPIVELASTAFTGPLFGYISLKTKSIYPMVAIHTTIYLAVVYFT